MKRKMYGLTFILFKESESLYIGLNTSFWPIERLNYYFICEEALPVRQSLYLLSKWGGQLYVFEGPVSFCHVCYGEDIKVGGGDGPPRSKVAPPMVETSQFSSSL